MNKKELANHLNGNSYRNEIGEGLEKLAWQNKLVVVFGASDDLMEFRGAIDDEFGCYDGGICYLNKDGLLEECDDECSHYIKAKKLSKTIEAIWCEEGYSWIYKTEIPHETFDIYEDGEKYCRGIVFSLQDIQGVI